VFTDITPDFVPMQIGTNVSFTAQDLDGNEVNSSELFSQSEITVVNVWRTWCGVCINEFPDLQEIKDSYGRRVGLVTYCNDALDAERIDTAISIVGDYNFTANLRQSDQLDEYFKCDSTPYTYFLDSNGNSLCYPISGADLPRTKDYIQRLLNGEKIQDVIEPPSSDQHGHYMVLMTDNDNNPVEGAMVSFCTDTACDVVRTDAKGIANYTGPKQNYHIHIVSVPSGYSFDDDGTISLDDDGSSVWLVVGKD
jgi:thiol-disulfide isomerase/thioredoxin